MLATSPKPLPDRRTSRQTARHAGTYGRRVACDPAHFRMLRSWLPGCFLAWSLGSVRKSWDPPPCAWPFHVGLPFRGALKSNPRYRPYAPHQFLRYWTELWRTYEQRMGTTAWKADPSKYRLLTAAHMKVPRQSYQAAPTKAKRVKGIGVLALQGAGFWPGTCTSTGTRMWGRPDSFRTTPAVMRMRWP